MRSTRSLSAAALAGALVWIIPLSATRAQDSIDRPINIYVAGTAGGGIDLYARLLARHIGRHIPGKPTVNVQVMPGAGGIRAANFLAQQAPKDGTAFTAFAGGPILEPLIGSRKPDYDSSKFTWIGAISKDVGMCVAWGASPFKTIQDAQRETMIVAGTGAGSDTDTWPVILNELIGTKFKLVTGYVGTQETIIAIERGEAHGRCTFSLSAIKTAKPDWLRDKKINVLFQMALRKHPEIPDVPFIPDLAKTPEDRQVFEFLFTPQEFGRAFFAPPDVPPARLQALRQAFERTLNDRAFLDDAEKAGLEIQYVAGDVVQKQIERVYATPKAIIERARTIAQ
jgi:tripartite-type tricarboxylate transporter receptor subunit TctC